ncbi:hypothetical protein D3C87_1763390 [compost metagenome]
MGQRTVIGGLAGVSRLLQRIEPVADQFRDLVQCRAQPDHGDAVLQPWLAHGHMLGDVPALLLVAIVLGALICPGGATTLRCEETPIVASPGGF